MPGASVKAEVGGQKSEIRRQKGSTGMRISSAKDLDVYKKAYSLSMAIFQQSKSFPAETESSLDFARGCGYITSEKHNELATSCAEVGRMLGSMIKDPSSFLISEVRPPTSDL